MAVRPTAWGVPDACVHGGRSTLRQHRLGNLFRRGREKFLAGGEVQPLLDLAQLDVCAASAHDAALTAQRRVLRLQETVLALDAQVEDLDGVCAAIQRALDTLVEERHATAAESLRFQAELRVAETAAADVLSKALTSRLLADDERLRRPPIGLASPQSDPTAVHSVFEAPALRPLADASS